MGLGQFKFIAHDDETTEVTLESPRRISGDTRHPHVKGRAVRVVAVLLGILLFGSLGVTGSAGAVTKLKVVGTSTVVCLRGVAAPGGADYGCLSKGASVSVVCWVKGAKVTAHRKGRTVSSRHWARTTGGRYISHLYLNARKHPFGRCTGPAPTQPTVPTTPVGTINPASCPAKPAVFDESHMQPAAIAVARCAAAKWPQITWIGGWRKTDPYPDHPSGQAVDIMLPGGCSTDPAKLALANAVADFFMRNAAAYGVVYIISQQRTWSNGRDAISSPDTWRHMSDRGDCTSNHRDHVHVSTIGPVHLG